MKGILKIYSATFDTCHRYLSNPIYPSVSLYKAAPLPLQLHHSITVRGLPGQCTVPKHTPITPSLRSTVLAGDASQVGPQCGEKACVYMHKPQEPSKTKYTDKEKPCKMLVYVKSELN
jgi:hypothetical protein